MSKASEVREAYMDSLTGLTFNSRPVIMSLTELAHDYSRAVKALRYAAQAACPRSMKSFQ